MKLTQLRTRRDRLIADFLQDYPELEKHVEALAQNSMRDFEALNEKSRLEYDFWESGKPRDVVLACQAVRHAEREEYYALFKVAVTA